MPIPTPLTLLGAPADSSGALEAVVDSTPLIRRFEAEFNERHATPVDPVTAFRDVACNGCVSDTRRCRPPIAP